ncbi:toll/interleukin-1 receptor domain-containing protein [Terasakiella sp. A23]|uniref:toll/interleukin-1 receptor domain-containing protein n=1 Tax=Terasakiella sp. FCG-A23 TaxID=3080561 RepID=UPI002952D22D|nr:toll/interleukin-1 receptor domain-containing protein [Terasakiella sp. A23]MDV7339189.1 toll/interleukin-1 receptor domain-containing protein [Terasakiella sp. A23]
MTKAFISYSIKDEPIARQLHSALVGGGVETFLASLSIEAGGKWADNIFDSLNKAEWVFFLASKDSCASHAVQQELGASLIQKKTIVPILVDIEPEELPGWVSQHQAVRVNDAPEVIQSVISKVSETVKSDKFKTGVICGALLAGFFMLLKK